jgi:tetratricopeptide (TPR) repeat protein
MTEKKAVRGRVLRFVLCGLLLLLAACGQKALTYEEQINLGQRFLEEGDYEQAIVAFTAAIQIEPKLSPAYMGLADAHKGLGQPEEAVAAIRQGVEAISDVASSGDLIAWVEIFGDEAFVSGDYDTAILAYDTLVFADPRSEYFQKLAEAYIAAGDVDSAIEILGRGYDHTGDETLLDLADRLKESSDEGEALGMIQIIDVLPKAVNYGVETTFDVTVRYTSANTENCIIYAGANIDESDQYILLDEYILAETTGVYTFSFTCTPVLWADAPFGVYVNISPYPHADSWSPFGYNLYHFD